MDHTVINIKKIIQWRIIAMLFQYIRNWSTLWTNNMKAHISSRSKNSVRFGIYPSTGENYTNSQLNRSQTSRTLLLTVGRNLFLRQLLQDTSFT